MTTKERKADALLSAASEWQNGYVVIATQAFWTEDNSDGWTSICEQDSDVDFGTSPASASLSEVAGLGFDIVNADGSDCEKVAEVDWPRSDDENRYIMRKVLK